MRTVTLYVDGMRCRRCVRQATALVRDVAGVDSVMADRSTGLITVRGTMTSDDLLASLKSTDFATRVLQTAVVPE